ncbi:hypothetical protein [Bacillus xiapuensis]|uniref:Uncharacterized protein n=1 Tax=Bacillus xiapuensis TaxID=2014075 RepID=A0ABU6N8H5_9BACI|nr:hypothetical protein [Bacillus xiapuensis]
MEEITLGDPNVLLTTLVSLNGVLVAIIGGFLVSRLIAISTERNGIKRSSAGYQQQIKRIDEKIEKLDEKLLKPDQTWFAKESKGKVWEDVPFEELLNDDYINPNKRTEEELKQTYDALVKEKEKILEKNKDKQMPPELKEKLKGIKINHSFLLTRSEESIAAEKRRLEKEAEAKRKKELQDFLDSKKPILDEKEEQTKEIHYLNKKIEDNELSLSRIVEPKGIIAGIVFIVTAIILGIFFPLLFLPMKDGTMTNGLRLTLLGATFFILLYFIIYLVVLAADSDNE